MAENTSGQGKSAIVPNEIKGWNWGALFFNIIWGIFNRTYFALLMLVPIVGMVIGRWLLVLDQQHQFLNWQSNNPLRGVICITGRHSLLIYMIHQPILFGSLYAVSSLTNF